MPSSLADWSIFERLTTFARDVDAYPSLDDMVDHLVVISYRAGLAVVSRTFGQLSSHRLIFYWAEIICMAGKAARIACAHLRRSPDNIYFMTKYWKAKEHARRLMGEVKRAS